MLGMNLRDETSYPAFVGINFINYMDGMMDPHVFVVILMCIPDVYPGA